MLPGIRFTPPPPDIGDTPLLQYLDEDGLKAPKYGSTGTIPFEESVRAAIEEVR
jgi:hypothetical protein